MEDLYIRKTHQCPGVFFMASGQLVIQGISIPPANESFYGTVLKWLRSFANQLPPRVTLNLEFEYLDASSLGCLRDIIETVDAYADKGTEVSINWVWPYSGGNNLAANWDLKYYKNLGVNFIQRQTLQQ